MLTIEQAENQTHTVHDRRNESYANADWKEHISQNKQEAKLLPLQNLKPFIPRYVHGHTITTASNNLILHSTAPQQSSVAKAVTAVEFWSLFRWTSVDWLQAPWIRTYLVSQLKLNRLDIQEGVIVKLNFIRIIFTQLCLITWMQMYRGENVQQNCRIAK